MWILIFALLNIVLFVFSIYFLLNQKTIRKIPLKPKFFIERFLDNWLPLLIIFIIVGFHLIEVKFIDPIVTDWVGFDYADTIQSFENGIVYWFSQNWTLGLLYFFVLIYIIIYTFTLWFSPFYFIIGNKKKAMKFLVYGLLIIYIISLPFYLFIPVTNVYTFYGVESPLEQVIPSIDNFFYATTTTNNCLPSMHTAMTILIAYCLSLTGNRKLKFFGYFVMVSVMISVIYLSIHWITDVITGAMLAIGVIFIL